MTAVGPILKGENSGGKKVKEKNGIKERGIEGFAVQVELGVTSCVFSTLRDI